MSRQDHGVPEPRVRVRVLLGLMRALAGVRGESVVAWRGQGFAYVLTVTRVLPGPDVLDMDVDPNVTHLDELVEQVRAALTPDP